ncbi:MAG: sulfite exporter TauE/SafE family protein [Syntrophobacteraceae bacterium]
MEWLPLSVMSAGVLFAAFCQGLTGFGFALLSIPVLAGFMGMKEAVIVGSGLCFIHYGLLAARSYRDLSFKSNTGIIIGTFLGMSLGMYIFIIIDELTLRLATGAVICCSGVLLIGGWFPKLSGSGSTKITVGALSGVLQTTTGMGGPPYVVYFASRKLPAQEFRGKLTSMLVLIYCPAFIALALTPAAKNLSLQDTLFLFPPLIVGFELGVRLSKIISDRFFRIVVHTLIIVSGTTLILSSLRTI